MKLFVPFHATGLFLHPLKTSENRKFKDTSRMKCVKVNVECDFINCLVTQKTFVLENFESKPSFELVISIFDVILYNLTYACTSV